MALKKVSERKLRDLLWRVGADEGADPVLDADIRQAIFPEDRGTAPEFTSQVCAAQLLMPDYLKQSRAARHIVAAELRRMIEELQAEKPSVQRKALNRFLARFQRDNAARLSKKRWGQWVDSLPLDEFMAMISHNWKQPA